MPLSLLKLWLPVTVALAANEVRIPEVAFLEPEIDQELGDKELAEVATLADPEPVTFTEPEEEKEENADEDTMLRNRDEEDTDATEDDR